MSSKPSTFLRLFTIAMSLWFVNHSAYGQETDAHLYGLPTGIHPRLKSILGEDIDDDEQNNLNAEIKNLGQQIKTTVKSVTAKRSFSCFGQPCNLKVFPMMYTRIYSGFWGGARARLTNDTRTDPFLYAFDFNLQRSDTQLSTVEVGLDIPHLKLLPYHPRFKAAFGAWKTNEARYFGVGENARYYERHRNLIDQTRYNIEQYQIENLLAFRFAVVRKQTYSFFTGFHYTSVETATFHEASVNKLFVDKPRGYDGGKGGAWTFGIISDSRDSEFMAHNGWMVEAGVSIGGRPIGAYKFTRYFLNDRRYFTYKRTTIAHRLTFDVINGDIPYWETQRVEGILPLGDIASSDVLRTYFNGRFHEPFKLIESLEWRYVLGRIWFFGLHPEMIFVPTAINFGQMGDVSAWSLSTGSYFAFTNSFLAQLFAGYAPTGWNFNLLFGVNI